jgi:hypothetical protein
MFYAFFIFLQYVNLNYVIEFFDKEFYFNVKFLHFFVLKLNIFYCYLIYDLTGKNLLNYSLIKHALIFIIYFNDILDLFIIFDIISFILVFTWTFFLLSFYLKDNIIIIYKININIMFYY